MIHRRELLKLLGLGTAASCLTRGIGPLFAQATAAPTPGVTADVIRIGMSAAFHGTAAGLGTEYLRGSLAYFQEVNSHGGIHGRLVEVVALDDGYEPVPTITNTIQLVDKERVLCLFNYVGTPTLTRALPLIKLYADQDLILVGALTGAQPQRNPPYAAQVFNIRASYREEMKALVDHLWEQGVRKFGVFYQIDAYGRSGTDNVALALQQHGARIVDESTYRRGSSFSEDMTLAVRHLRSAGVEAVVCTGAYQGCAAFIRDARDLGWNVPITNLSFVGSESMSRLLVAEGAARQRDYTHGLIGSQVVPSYGDSRLPGVALYRDLMDRLQTTPDVLPEAIRDRDYKVERYSFISLEGFINARVLVEALRRAGPDLTRRGLKAALESIADLDLGIGARLRFGPDRHQGLNQVYFTRLERSSWVPVHDWNVALRS